MSKHNFVRSLKKGLDAEAKLLELWPELVRLDGRKGDFTLEGIKMEVKSDFYGLSRTKNLFIERWSNFDRKKPGSVWQALEHGCDLFFYWFPADQVGFLFSTRELLALVEATEHKYDPVFVQNKSWRTVGYKVPIKSLLSIAIRKEWKV